MTDILFEIVRAIITGIIFFYLSIQGWKQNLRLQRGWLLIQFGFGLLLMGSLVDITDNFPELNRFILIGQTGYEAFLEKIVGYTMGFLLLAVGFWKWLPTVVALGTAQNALRESEARFRSVYNNIGIGIALIGKDMELLSINPEMQKWFPHIEINQQHTCYKSFNTPPRDSVCSYCPTVLTLQDGRVHTAVTDTPTDNGIRNYQIISSPLLAEDGTIIAAIEMVEDITEQKKQADELKDTKKSYELATSIGKIGIWDWNPVTGDLAWNDETFLVFGLEPGSVRPSYELFLDTVHPEDREFLNNAVQEALHRKKHYSVDCRIILGNGKERTCHASGEVEFSETDEPVRMLGTFQDITERKQAEENIRQSEQFIRSILDTVDEGFIVVDQDYRILTANKAYCSQVGGCDNTIIGKHCYEISHKTDRPCYEEGEECATRHAFETGTFHTALHRHKDANGTMLYVETKAFPIKNASGAVTSVIETINNITEKYLLEEERLKTQKLESIGTLAGGIAHDFNNLLQGVFGYISMAKLTHDRKEKSLAMLDQAEEALHLSVNLTTQLLTFSKGGKPLKKLIRLDQAIENAVKFALSGSHTDYRLNITPDLWPVEADAGQLAQVIQNIVLNANEAMAGRGTVQVSVQNMDILSKLNPRLPEGGRFVRIDIEDTGTGISEQNQSKIFDPYFTTKQKGSGLGLATTYSIIRNHGGVIEVKSKLNRGTTFTLYLPASSGAEIPAELTAPAAVTTKTGRVLLMDDEDMVRNVAKEMIAAFGHDVVSAEDGKKAIELFSQAREAGKPFDLIILDLTVKGGMGGEEAIRKIREIDPQVKAVVSSGYADSPVVADYRAYGFSAVLNKPYKLEALQNCFNLFIS